MPEIQKDDSGSKKLPTHTKVVVIGGGIVGCSILFHLAKFGWKDVVLLERDELTSGSSWHAAGQIHTLSSDPNISRLQSYTIDLYKEVEKLSGHSVGLHITGGFYLASTPQWYDYLKRERSKARYMGLDQEFISPREMAERHPLIDPKHYHAVLWDAQDGDLDPSGTTYAFAKAAKVHGARYFTHTPVTATTQRSDGSWDVIPNVVNTDSYDRSFQGFWLGAIGDLVPVPRANRNNVQNPWKSGLRWPKFAHRTSLHLLNDDPYRPPEQSRRGDAPCRQTNLGHHMGQY